MKCHTKQTKITLLDGREWSFRALPFNEDTINLLADIEGKDGKELHILLMRSVRQSMSYDQTPEEVEQAFASGALPSPSNELFLEVIAATSL